jgi:hypothetical protein
LILESSGKQARFEHIFSPVAGMAETEHLAPFWAILCDNLVFIAVIKALLSVVLEYIILGLETEGCCAPLSSVKVCAQFSVDTRASGFNFRTCTVE